MTNKSFHAGAMAGALTATIACATTLAAPTLISLLHPSNTVGGKVLLVFLFIIPSSLVAALLGAITGGLATNAENAVMGGMVGAGLSVSLAILHSVSFVTLAEQQQTHASIKFLLFSGSLGALTGWVAWQAGNIQLEDSGRHRFQISLTDMAFLMAVTAAHVSVYA